MAAKLKKDDEVLVITGRDKGKKGKILKVFPDLRRALVSDINLATHHEKQTRDEEGGRIARPASIDLSNLLLIDPKTGKPTRVGFRIIDKVKHRFSKKTGELI